MSRSFLRISPALLFCGAAAIAQTTTTAKVTGIVTDSLGGQVSHATVVLHRSNSRATQTAQTDASGHFSFDVVAPANLEIDADAPGFAVTQKQNVIVGEGASVDVALALRVSNINEQVTVEADATHSVAAALAPMDALLDETSARTEITSTMIKNFMSPVADYGEAVEMAPGTFTTNGNGVGLGQSKTNFRGFPDGDYDIKFDGIPWSDTNSVSHHSWAFFPTQFLGGIDFDRSPGTASTIGYAPFGGSINLLSRPFAPVQNIRGSISYGSFNTKLFDVEYDSGSFGRGNKLNLNVDVHHLGSDGYQTNNFQTRNAGDLQLQYKISDRTVLTGFSSVIWLDANTPNFNATRCQMYGAGPGYACTGANAAFAGSGINFYLTDNSDPTNYLDYQYNYYHVPTDFEYVGLHKEFSHGFLFDIKPYTYNYDNSEKYSNATAITPANCALNAKATYVCGVDKYNSYRTYGETSQMSQVSKFGIFRTGMWYSWSNTNRHQAPSNPLANWVDAALPNFSETFVQDSYQPFAEYEYHPTSKLLITPGVKLSYYTIGTKQFADNGGKIGGLGSNNPAAFIANGGSYFSVLPSVAANYHIHTNWSVYGQYATGSITPPSNTFDFTQSATGTPVSTLPEQQKTTTYQTGTVLKLKRVTLDVSYFHVHFGSGYSSFTPLDTGEPIYYQTSPSVTQGVEAESNISMTHGFSLYLNASYDNAKYVGATTVYCTVTAKGCNSTVPSISVNTPNNLFVANTPSDILTEGLTYQHKAWDAGIFNKTVGTQRLDDGGFHNEATISPFTLTNLFFNYTIRGNNRFNNTKLRLSFNNLFDEHNITGNSLATKVTSAAPILQNGTSYADPFNANFAVAPISGSDSVTVLPGRSVVFSAQFGFGPTRR